MSKVLSSFMTRQVAEGQALSYTYSVVDEGGNFTKRNVKGSFLVTDEAVMAHIEAINQYIQENKLDGE